MGAALVVTGRYIAARCKCMCQFLIYIGMKSETVSVTVELSCSHDDDNGRRSPAFVLISDRSPDRIFALNRNFLFSELHIVHLKK